METRQWQWQWVGVVRNPDGEYDHVEVCLYTDDPDDYDKAEAEALKLAEQYWPVSVGRLVYTFVLPLNRPVDETEEADDTGHQLSWDLDQAWYDGMQVEDDGTSRFGD